jgi:hypothetical protein
MMLFDIHDEMLFFSSIFVFDNWLRIFKTIQSTRIRIEIIIKRNPTDMSEIIFHFSRYIFTYSSYHLSRRFRSICLLYIENVFIKDFFLNKVNNMIID